MMFMKCNMKEEISNFYKIDVNSFDTAIVGHLRELGNILNKNLKTEVLEFCLENNKNAYCLDDTDTLQYEEEFKKKGLQLFYPKRHAKYISSKSGKLYQLATPSLLVLGTNKKQGKFTFQMQLKRLLSKKGYKVGYIPTEPTGILFGCECMFPYGYEGVYTPDNVLSVEYINEKVFEIDKKMLDLNIIGLQSCFLPRNFYNKGDVDLNSLSILYATRPDAAILVIDYNDSIDFIKRNIMALKALTDTDVIALALNSYDAVYDYEIDSLKTKLSNSQIFEKKAELFDNLGLETFVVGDMTEDNKICDTIEAYYGEQV